MSTAMREDVSFITQTIERNQATFVDGNHQYVVALTCEVCQSTGELIVCKCQHVFYCSEEHQAEVKQEHSPVCADIQKKATTLRKRHNALLDALHFPKLDDMNSIADPPLSATRTDSLASSELWKLHQSALWQREHEYSRAALLFISVLQDVESRFCLCSTLMSLRNYYRIWENYDENVLIRELLLLLQLGEYASFWQRLAPAAPDHVNVTTMVDHIISRFDIENRLSVQAIIFVSKVKVLAEYIPDGSQTSSFTDVHGRVTLRRDDDVIRGLKHELPQLVLQLQKNNPLYWWMLQNSAGIKADIPKIFDSAKRRRATSAWDKTQDLWLAQPELFQTVVSILEQDL